MTTWLCMTLLSCAIGMSWRTRRNWKQNSEMIYTHSDHRDGLVQRWANHRNEGPQVSPGEIAKLTLKSCNICNGLSRKFACHRLQNEESWNIQNSVLFMRRCIDPYCNMNLGWARALWSVHHLIPCRLVMVLVFAWGSNWQTTRGAWWLHRQVPKGRMDEWAIDRWTDGQIDGFD